MQHIRGNVGVRNYKAFVPISLWDKSARSGFYAAHPHAAPFGRSACTNSQGADLDMRSMARTADPKDRTCQSAFLPIRASTRRVPGRTARQDWARVGEGFTGFRQGGGL